MRAFVRKIAAGIAMSCLISGHAAATLIYVEPTSDGSSVEATITSSFCLSPCSITTTLSDGLDDLLLPLGIDEAWSFDFFDITLDGWGFGTADITATLAFEQPETFVASSGSGSFFTFYGTLSGGSLVWDQPSYITLADGTELGVSFEDIDFDFGLTGTTTVSTTVGRYYPVPEPGTLALFGIGLLVLGFTSRRTVASAQTRSQGRKRS